MSHFRPLHRYVAVSAALLAAASCGEGLLTTQPDETSRIQRVDAPPAFKRGAHVARGMLLKRNSTLRQDVSASATITPDGGSLSLPEAGLTLYFPSGAVSQTIVVTATALRDKGVAYDFQPHGTVFNTPIYVAQSLIDTELNAARANKKREVWAGYLSNGAADIQANGTARFTETFDAFLQGKETETFAVFVTTHFSGYALASGRRPAVELLELE